MRSLGSLRSLGMTLFVTLRERSDSKSLMEYGMTVILGVIVLAGCEVYPQDEYREYYVVESFLIANGPLSVVRLSTTSHIDSSYNTRKNYVSDAEVEIRLLREDSTIVRRYPYEGEGAYYAVDDSERVRGGRLYQLHITTPSGEEITSYTQVPGDLRTVNELRERYYFEGEEQIRITTTPSAYPGRQTYYIFTLNAINPSRDKLTPFYYNLVEKEGQHPGIYWKNSYGIFNASSYKQHADGTVTLQVPWLAVAFYGPNDVTINAIDDNMYDFMRTQRAQSSGSESILSGELRNIKYNIEGGIGVFGSMASDTNRVEIWPPEEE